VVERDRRGVRYLECGVITPNARAALGPRLVEIAEGLGEVIDELRPDQVALEDVFHGDHARAALRLGHARGVAMYMAAQRGLPVHEYPPARVRRFVIGHGGATKAEVAVIVRGLCGLRTTPRADAVDALAVAFCHVLGGALTPGHGLSSREAHSIRRVR
jgi:crossover junction endodeoxyribonuclease RuvC